MMFTSWTNQTPSPVLFELLRKCSKLHAYSKSTSTYDHSLLELWFITYLRNELRNKSGLLFLKALTHQSRTLRAALPASALERDENEMKNDIRTESACRSLWHEALVQMLRTRYKPQPKLSVTITHGVCVMPARKTKTVEQRKSIKQVSTLKGTEKQLLVQPKPWIHLSVTQFPHRFLAENIYTSQDGLKHL